MVKPAASTAPAVTVVVRGAPMSGVATPKLRAPACATMPSNVMLTVFACSATIVCVIEPEDSRLP